MGANHSAVRLQWGQAAACVLIGDPSGRLATGNDGLHRESDLLRKFMGSQDE